jgi:hypothetical protein
MVLLMNPTFDFSSVALEIGRGSIVRIVRSDDARKFFICRNRG